MSLESGSSFATNRLCMLVHVCAVVRTTVRLMGLAKVFMDPESKIPAPPW